MDGAEQGQGGTAGWRRGLSAGLIATLPVLLGVAPFGLVFGVVATETGLDLAQTMAMTAAVIAGASQLAALQLLSDGAPAVLAVLAGAVVNLRMAMYSAALLPWWQGVGRSTRALVALVLHDHSFALSVGAYRARPEMGLPERLGFFLAVGGLTSSVWIAATWLGAVHGAAVLDGLDIGFVIPVTFMAITAPMLHGRPALLAAAVAAGLGVLMADLPYGTGLLVAAAGGIGAGLVAEGRSR